jgi:hypothetical protein
MPSCRVAVKDAHLRAREGFVLDGREHGGTLVANGARTEGMRDTDLMQLALGLVPPWMVKACNLDAGARRLDIEIDFAKGGRFPCSNCGKVDCPSSYRCSSSSPSSSSS